MFYFPSYIFQHNPQAFSLSLSLSPLHSLTVPRLSLFLSLFSPN